MNRKINLDFSSQTKLGKLIFVVYADESKRNIFDSLEEHILRLDSKIPETNINHCYRNFRIKKKIKRFELKVVYHFSDDSRLAQIAQQDAIKLCNELENITENSN